MEGVERLVFVLSPVVKIQSIQEGVTLPANKFLHSVNDVLNVGVVGQEDRALAYESSEILVQALTDSSDTGLPVLKGEVLALCVITPQLFPRREICLRGGRNKNGTLGRDLPRR